MLVLMVLVLPVLVLLVFVRKWFMVGNGAG